MFECLNLLKKVNHNKSFVEEALRYDTNTLGQTNGEYLSRCIIALSQYSISFKIECNDIKVSYYQKERLLESALFHLITPEIIKKYKTKKDARAALVLTDPTLNALQLDLDVLQDSIYLAEGLDKPLSDLIASLKRELTRRENELYQQRKS